MDLIKVDVIDFLESLGIRNVTDAGEEIQFSCPFPGHTFGDETPSAYMNRDSTAFFCHGCKEKGNAIHFLSKYEAVSPILAANWIRDRYASGFLDPGESFLTELEQMLIHEEPVPHTNQKIHYELDVLVDEPLEYMHSRGFCDAAIKHWGLGYDPISDRVAIPIMDEYNNLVGFKARSYKEGHNPKYLALGDVKHNRYGFKPYEKSKVVFGLHNAIFSNPDHVIIVEGELNAIAMWQYGFTNTVALSGSHFSDYQRDQILTFFDAVTVFVDSDRAGQQVSADIVDSLFPYMKVSLVDEHEGDPADLSSEQCSKIVNSAIAVNELWAREIDEENKRKE